MNRDTRNQRALNLAHRLEAVIAANITAGIRQLQAERLSAIDGPTRGETEPNRTGMTGGFTSSTERNANEAYRLGLLVEDLRDALHGAEVAIAYLDKLSLEAVRTRAFSKALEPEAAAVEEARCRDKQVGKDGAIEWGDVTCLELGTKAGMCQAHYMRWWRWRVDHGIDTSRDFQPSEVA